MADPLPDPDTTMPRWVKVSAVIGIILLALVGLMLLLGHGPGQHTESMHAPSESAAQ